MSKISLISIDTAKRVFHLVGIDQGGQYTKRRQLSRTKLLPALANMDPCRIVLEACAASHHWARQMEGLGHQVQLIAAQNVKPFRRGQKNDYRDAEAIVSAALSPGMHFVGVKSVQQQAEQALHRVRTRLTRHHTATANELRGLLGEYGHVYAQGFAALRRGAVDFIDSGEAEALGLTELVRDLLDEMSQLKHRIQQYDRQIKQRVRADEISRQLQAELNGVGVLGASALRVKVADPRDYHHGRNFAAYLGLAPSHKGTGGNVKIGKLPKQRDRYVRQLLIHGARSVVSRLGTKTDAQSCWLRGIRERRGFNTACVALAHKNARQAWAIMARERATHD